MISQSTKIFGLLIFLFIVYITTKGELSAYLSVFTGTASNSSTTSTSNAVAPASTSNQVVTFSPIQDSTIATPDMATFTNNLPTLDIIAP